VTVFDANGKVRYSTYLGGSGVEGEGGTFTDDNSNGNNIAVDAQGLVYVTGTTSSGGSERIKFPVTPKNAIQTDLRGSTDAFLCIIDPAKSGKDSMVYSSFLGGDREEKGHGVAVNAGGSHVTVVGYTRSLVFPTTPNAYRSRSVPSDYHSNGFVTQFTSSLPGDPSSQYTMRYSTYLGGDTKDARDNTYAVTLDPRGLIATTGRTMSADFPMNPSYAHSIHNSAPFLKPGTSNNQPHLVKIDPSLIGKASLAYSTFLGGGGFCTGVAVDTQGRAWVAGETSAEGVEYAPSHHPVESPREFPYTQDALITSYQGSLDGILMQTNPNGTMLNYSTYFAGKGNDRSYGLAVDPAGNAVVTGLTSSFDFPLKNPAQTWPGGEQNAFVARFGFSFPQPIPALKSWGALLSFLTLAGASVWKMRRRWQGTWPLQGDGTPLPSLSETFSTVRAANLEDSLLLRPPLEFGGKCR
jgi:hypothetical protein